MAPLKVLIIGGGIAGPALAHWLSRFGADTTLIERAPTKRASGQQLDLRAQGVPMMRKMGIEDAVRAVTVKESGMQLIDVNGRVQAWFPANKTGTGKQSFSSEFEIMRADLVNILYGLTENRSNVKQLFGTTIKSFTQDDESDPNGKVHVTFNDGRREDYDLLVGADGTFSKTRKMMLGPNVPDPVHWNGGYIGYFSVPSMPGDTDRATWCHLPSPGKMARTIMTRKDCPELTRVYMLLRGKDDALEAAIKSQNLAELKKACADIYEDGGWECPRFMEALRNSPEADDLYCTPFEEVQLPKGSWSKGRVALIGDAAHSGTANGLGTSWGLIGAYILAGEIATLYEKDRSSPTAAVIQGAKNYEEIFRPIATSGHNGPEWIENMMFPKSTWGIWIMHKIAGIASHFHFDQGAGLDGKAGKWELPDYPELEKVK